MFELTYNYGKDSLADYGGEEEFKGNAYAQTALSTTVSCASQLPSWSQHASAFVPHHRPASLPVSATLGTAGRKTEAENTM